MPVTRTISGAPYAGDFRTPGVRLLRSVSISSAPRLDDFLLVDRALTGTFVPGLGLLPVLRCARLDGFRHALDAAISDALFLIALEGRLPHAQPGISFN